MSNIKVIITFILALVLTYAMPVKASVELTDEEYAKLRLFFSPGKITMLTEDEIAYHLAIDEADITTQRKFYKVTITDNGTLCEEVTEAEALQGVGIMQGLSGMVGTMGTYYSTNYKEIRLTANNLGDNMTSLYLVTNWFITPVTKSFDVTGIRVFDATILNQTQSGSQIATYADGSHGYVGYSWNGTNIVKKTNGFGISMNLINNGVGFSTDIYVVVTATSQYAKAYGTYQHAITNVTLAESQSYNISASGLGQVLNFASAVENLYDGMQGVQVNLAYSS